MIAYFDLPSGLSGDMFLGCLIDAGWPIDDLRETVRRLGLPVEEWAVDSTSVMKGPLRAVQVQVRAQEGHVHRHLRHIREMIEAADISSSIKQRSIGVFTRLAEAEAKVHGTTPEMIHFHEVGAVDAIIDIVASIAGIEALGIEQVYASAVPTGEGWAHTAHGKIPLPAPATLELLASVGAPTTASPGPGELLTPTGAALLAELAIFEQPMLSVQKVGLGAGQRECEWPNIARLWLGQAKDTNGKLVQLQTNIDDMNPQVYPVIMQKLLEIGAKDTWLTPVQMKKGRPGVVLNVLTPVHLESSVCQLLLQETTTLGIRALPVSHRAEAQRKLANIQTEWGQIPVKIKLLDGVPVDAVPEFEACRALAETHGLPVRIVIDRAKASALKDMANPGLESSERV